MQASMLQSSQTVHSIDIAYRYSRGVGTSPGVGGSGGIKAPAIRLGLNLNDSFYRLLFGSFLSNVTVAIVSSLGVHAYLAHGKLLGSTVGPFSSA